VVKLRRMRWVEAHGTQHTGRNKKCIQSFSWKTKERTLDLVIDGRIILKWMLETEGMDWVQLA
jgi:hypothetical protein